MSETEPAIPLKKDDPVGYEILRKQCREIFLEGECYAFAVALHRSLGWQIIGLISGVGTIRHALLRDHSGNHFDARGYVVHEAEIGKPFEMRPPLRLRDISEDDLFACGDISDFAIQEADRMAHALWPYLKWKDADSCRRQAFLDELHELSRRHGIRITSRFPAAYPVLSDYSDHEEIERYTLLPTASGGFLIR